MHNVENTDNALCMEENHLMDSLLVKPKPPSLFFHIADYHRNRVFVIIQFCHTRLAWIVSIISPCGQHEAICCKITSPCGEITDRLSRVPLQAYYPFTGQLTLNCMQGFHFGVIREALCLFRPQTFKFDDIVILHLA